VIRQESMTLLRDSAKETANRPITVCHRTRVIFSKNNNLGLIVVNQ